MMIEWLALNGFRGFRDFRVTFSPFTCLVGPNNGGKTSVLQAVRLLHDLVVASFGGRDRPDYSNPQWLFNPQNALRRNAAGDIDAIWLDKRTSEPCKIVAGMSEGVEIRVDIQGRGRYELDILKDGKSIRQDLDPNKLVVEDTFALRPYYAPPIGAVSPAERFQTEAELRSRLDRGEVAENWRLNLWWLWNGGDRRRFDEITSSVQRRLRGCVVLPPRLTGGSETNVAIQFEQAGTTFNITAGGGGMVTLVNVASVLTYAGSRCFLFDEPDGHLHGTLQREMAHMLQDFSAENHVQILVASHAPDFIAEVDADFLVWIDRAAQQGKKCTTLGKFLVDLGSLNKADAIRAYGANKVLFLEGKGIDRRVLGAVWAKSGFENNPFEDGTVVTPPLPSGKGDAKHLPTFQSMLREGFGVVAKMAAIVDCDYELAAEATPGAEADDPLVVQLPRKEVENYLLDSGLIASASRKLAENIKRDPADVPEPGQIEGEIQAVLEDEEVWRTVKAQLVCRQKEKLRIEKQLRRITPAIEEEGDRWWEERWGDPAWRRDHCPGSAVLTRVLRRCHGRWGFAPNREMLIANLQTFPEDLRPPAEKLNRYFYGDVAGQPQQAAGIAAEADDGPPTAPEPKE